MVVAPAFSATLVELRDSVTPVGAASLSVMVIVGLLEAMLLELLTVMVSFTSSTLSSVGVSVKVAVPFVPSAAISRSKSDTAAKSTASAVPEPSTLILSVCFAP